MAAAVCTVLPNPNGDMSPRVTACFRCAHPIGRSSVRSRVDPDLRLHELQFGQAVASTRWGRHDAIFQPVVCPAALPARSVPWLPWWFQASRLDASRRPP
jgi:hypothetical protein